MAKCACAAIFKPLVGWGGVIGLLLGRARLGGCAGLWCGRGRGESSCVLPNIGCFGHCCARFRSLNPPKETGASGRIQERHCTRLGLYENPAGCGGWATAICCRADVSSRKQVTLWVLAGFRSLNPSKRNRNWKGIRAEQRGGQYKRWGTRWASKSGDRGLGGETYGCRYQ